MHLAVNIDPVTHKFCFVSRSVSKLVSCHLNFRDDCFVTQIVEFEKVQLCPRKNYEVGSTGDNQTMKNKLWFKSFKVPSLLFTSKCLKVCIQLCKSINNQVFPHSLYSTHEIFDRLLGIETHRSQSYCN